ncbi:MAG: hypothetical protein M1136_00055 [Chloroflexi bacterium]|nr:hypothetical protein [Chloroflexota bacterium]MCL5074032.1 hypothetical protein [Chloroflexota bacterium]
MNSSLISKIEKARRYAQERDRVTFTKFEVNFQGENAVHAVSYCDGLWHCDCSFFASRGVCSHTMAMQKILGEMLPASIPNTPHDLLEIPLGRIGE